MMIIGCDFHPSWQQITWFDTETGETGEGKLVHAAGEAKQFYQQWPAGVLIDGWPTSRAVGEMWGVCEPSKRAKVVWKIRSDQSGKEQPHFSREMGTPQHPLCQRFGEWQLDVHLRRLQPRRQRQQNRARLCLRLRPIRQPLAAEPDLRLGPKSLLHLRRKQSHQRQRRGL